MLSNTDKAVSSRRLFKQRSTMLGMANHKHLPGFKLKVPLVYDKTQKDENMSNYLALKKQIEAEERKKLARKRLDRKLTMGIVPGLSNIYEAILNVEDEP